MSAAISALSDRNRQSRRRIHTSEAVCTENTANRRLFDPAGRMNTGEFGGP